MPANPSPADVEDVDSDRPVERDGVLDVDFEREVEPIRYAITSYGADFPVDGLVRRLETGDIVVPSFDPEFETESQVVGFQRQYVWTKPQADRFIESLLLGFPVPEVFLVREPNNVMLVLDGQQRLRTLQAFYKGVLGSRTFSLKYVQEPFAGLTYEALDDEDRRRLDNSLIHATIMRQDEPLGDQGSVYQIFERINTSGTALQPQEIRVALFHGLFIQLLNRLNHFPAWRTLYGPESTRLKDHELILRFFALYFGRDGYHRPVKSFLNKFLSDNRGLQRYDENILTVTFETTTTAVLEGIGPRAFRPRASLNAAVADSVMVGVATRIESGPITDWPSLREAYNRLIVNPDYRFVVESSTAAEESVATRLRMAQEYFSGVE